MVPRDTPVRISPLYRSLTPSPFVVKPCLTVFRAF